jgi:hypothetical protein
MLQSYWRHQHEAKQYTWEGRLKNRLLRYFVSIQWPEEAHQELSVGNKIAAIKATRLNCRVTNEFGDNEAPGLKQAKDIVELWTAYRKFVDDKPRDDYDEACLQQFRDGVEPGHFDLNWKMRK